MSSIYGLSFTYPQSRNFSTPPTPAFYKKSVWGYSMFLMRIEIITKAITRAETREIAKEIYGTMVKGVADIERGIIALGGKWHMDANTKLMEHGSKQDSVWGFNLYTNKEGEERVEYVALINIRPVLGNRDMYIEDPTIRGKMRSIIDRLIP